MKDHNNLLTKWNWLKTACTDHRLNRTSVAVLGVILDHINKTTGEAWPGYGSIAKLAHTDPKTAKRAVLRLVKHGYLLKQNPTATRPSNTYTLGQLPPVGELAHRGESAPRGRGKAATGVGTNQSREVGAKRSPELIEENLGSEPIELNLLRFEEFWSLYPRSEGKKDAKRAWQQGKCDRAADLIMSDLTVRLAAGGDWYAKDPRYIPHPATYLNGERWNDEPPVGPLRPGAVAVDARSEQEIEAENAKAIARMGVAHVSH